MKSLIVILIVNLFSCTTPVRHYISPPEEKDSSVTFVTNPDNKPINVIPTHAILPPSIPVTEWVGKKFYVLPKQELVRANGYSLYSFKPGSYDSSLYRPDWELKNHRIRCESISGDTLTVTGVEPVEKEWIITLLHHRTGRQLYGQTTQNALQELALLDDLSNARKRWLHTTVFSKRGVISTIGATSSNSITSLKVNILDSLTVNDIKWGMTPLPVKPIWLMVSSPSGKSGFIPLRFSWTNTLTSHIKNHKPWEEDIFELDPRSMYDWEDYTWEVINNHRVILEMTHDQVLLSWGTPDSIQKKNTDDKSERWIYPSHECLFAEGKLAAISERKQH